MLHYCSVKSVFEFQQKNHIILKKRRILGCKTDFSNFVVKKITDEFVRLTRIGPRLVKQFTKLAPFKNRVYTLDQ